MKRSNSNNDLFFVIGMFCFALALVAALIVGLVIRDRINEGRAMRVAEEVSEKLSQEQEKVMKEASQHFQEMIDALEEN